MTLAPDQRSLRLTEAYREYSPRVRAWARAFGSPADQVEDVTHETFLRLIDAEIEFGSSSHLAAWLRTTASRLVIDRWRAAQSGARARVSRATQAAGAPAPEPDDFSLVRAALAGLSEMQRLVLISKTCDGQTFAQIAEELQIAIPTAKTHYLRALEAVRERLGVGERGNKS